MARITNIEAYDLALSLMKRAGFVLDHVSRISETCYFHHPARKPLLLRASTHKSKKSPIGLNDVVARVTFTNKDTTHLNEKYVFDRVTWAIGQYFLADQKPTRYQRKHGELPHEPR